MWQFFPAFCFQTAAASPLPQPELIHKPNFTDLVAVPRIRFQRYTIRISIGLSVVLADFFRIIPKPRQANVGKYVETGYDHFLLTIHNLLLVSFLHNSCGATGVNFPFSSRVSKELTMPLQYKFFLKYV
jgi:hypothetical protein